MHDFCLFIMLVFYINLSFSLYCLQPFVPENAHVIFNEPGPYVPDTVAKYSCTLGFERIGQEKRTCLSNGTWSGSAPVCALDIAVNKPIEQSSGGPPSASRGFCYITNNDTKSWWEVELLGSYSIHSIVMQSGKQSSNLVSIELMLDTGDLKSCDISSHSLSDSNIISVICSYDHVSKVRIITANRLELCAVHVYATNAVSSWQCAQDSMDVVGVFNGMCFTSSRNEETDWAGSQRKCLDRGATLPLRISESTRRGLRSALPFTTYQKEFYWIGVSSSTSEWRWADGDSVGAESDWPTIDTPLPRHAEAVLLARPLDWKWLPSTQTAWNAFLCQSKPNFCTSPGVGEASRVTFSSHSYAIGTYCFYSCENGYHLRGNNQRECQENGRWSGTIPQCIELDCGHIKSWSGGKIRLLNGSTKYKSEIEYECSIGWELVGERRRRCQSDGLWSGIGPKCKEVDCGHPASISNGRLFVTTTTFASQANYSCQEGYKLIGHDTIFCKENRSWEPTIPVCYDLLTLREMTSDSTSESNIFLALLAVILVCILVVTAFRFSRPTQQGNILNDRFGGTPGVIYTTPTTVPTQPDSIIYYASCSALTQMEVPPHMVSLQQLPNGNIHVTLPLGRYLVRPQIPVFGSSPTPSQLLYSFDHEPIYDVPPDINSDTIHEENIYDKLSDTKTFAPN